MSAPSILHIATHEFFPQPHSSSQAIASNPQSIAIAQGGAAVDREDALVLSGLAMAGANRRQSGALRRCERKKCRASLVVKRMWCWRLRHEWALDTPLTASSLRHEEIANASAAPTDSGGNRAAGGRSEPAGCSLRERRSRRLPSTSAWRRESDGESRCSNAVGRRLTPARFEAG